MDINEILDHERPTNRPQTVRRRFTPNESNEKFLQECERRNYDISTIINLAIESFQPKTKSNCFTWDGIDSVVKGKKKWF